MAQQYTVITQPFVNIQITSTASEFACEKRYAKDVTIGNLKGKLEMITGSSSTSMKLSLYNKDDKLLCLMDDDSAMLGSYPIEDGMRIHVVDPTVRVGQFEDVSKVEKFELSEEAYAQKRDTVRAFKERNKMGRFRELDPEEEKRKEEERLRELAAEKALCDQMKVDDRCEVTVLGQMNRRGTVKFIGEADFKPGYWVGVQYDEPLGKNDGSVGGKRYFQCQPKYGGFVKPINVKVGDFPEEDLNFSDDEI